MSQSLSWFYIIFQDTSCRILRSLEDTICHRLLYQLLMENACHVFVFITCFFRFNSTKSSHLFAFEHQEIYQKVQFMFYDAVESLDHNNIMVGV